MNIIRVVTEKLKFQTAR